MCYFQDYSPMTVDFPETPEYPLTVCEAVLGSEVSLITFYL